jgi:hypothetical protein
MTKIIFAAMVCLTIFFSLNSCKKKCLKCELTGGVTKTYPLTCGKADDRDLLMLECLNEAMKQNNNGNLTNCSCIEQ